MLQADIEAHITQQAALYADAYGKENIDWHISCVYYSKFFYTVRLPEIEVFGVGLVFNDDEGVFVRYVEDKYYRRTYTRYLDVVPPVYFPNA